MPEIERKKIAGLRDIISHEYLGIDIDTIWDVLDSRIPELQPHIISLRKKIVNED